MAKTKSVEIRLYRRHDLDLIMLRAYGLSVTKLMRLALLNYVDGERIKFKLPDSRSYNISEVTCARYRLTVSDTRIINLLENIKSGYRNQFCKQLLRDALDTAPLGAYLSDAYIQKETDRMKSDAQVMPLSVSSKRTGKRENTSEKVQKKLEKIAQEETSDIKKKKEITESVPDFLRDDSISLPDESIPDLFEDTSSVNNESLMNAFAELVSEGI